MTKRRKSDFDVTDHPYLILAAVGAVGALVLYLWILVNEYALADAEAGSVNGMATLLGYIWSLVFPLTVYAKVVWNEEAGVAQSPFGDHKFVSTVSFVGVGVVVALGGYFVTNLLVIPAIANGLYSLVEPNVGAIVLYPVVAIGGIILSAVVCVAIALPSGLGMFVRGIQRELGEGL